MAQEISGDSNPQAPPVVSLLPIILIHYINLKHTNAVLKHPSSFHRATYIQLRYVRISLT